MLGEKNPKAREDGRKEGTIYCSVYHAEEGKFSKTFGF